MRWILVVLTFGGAGAMAAPKFEVVSIRFCTESDAAANAGRGRKNNGGGKIKGSPGRLRLECQTVESLVRAAYVEFAGGAALSRRRLAEAVQGGPEWVRSEHYTIDARAEGAPSLETMRGPMMQTVLEERFHLRVRRESRSVPVYLLTVAKGGPKLQAAKAGTCITEQEMFANGPPAMGPGQLPICGGFFRLRDGTDGSYRQTVAGLCGELSRVLDRDVIDKTAIAGEFDFLMALSLGDDREFSVLAAVGKMGLRLEAAKGSSEVVTIDRVERPAGN